MLQPTTDWQVYTPVRALNPAEPVSKDNPAVGARGFVADYDVISSLESIVGYVNQIPAPFQPAFLETTLGAKGRLVWTFADEIPVADGPFLDRLWRELAKRGRWETALPGFDPASFKPSERWTNGGIWHTLTGQPIPQDIVVGAAIEAGKMMTKAARQEIPVARIAEEVAKRFPNRWAGAFDIDAVGVRFWDPTADAAAGAQVKPDGMLCFTGKIPFMKWADIFGRDWVNEQALLNLAGAVDGIYFDGRNYWHEFGGRWMSTSRQDIELHLAQRGLSSTKAKGQTISDCGSGLIHVQTSNRIEGAAPLINERPGICEYRGGTYLNIARLNPVVGTGAPANAGDFPWIWAFLEGLFSPPAEGSTHPLDHFLAWLKRGHFSVVDYLGEMGQILFLCGPKSAGKTLVTLRILVPLLGGRHANPYQYMVGDTGFTDDLFQCPVWAINDEDAPKNDGQRQKFLARLKATAVNPEHTYHPKFCPKLSVSWQGRMIVTLNDDPASTTILPEVNENTADKMMFFRAQPYRGVFPPNKVLEGIIVNELPFFADFLRDWEVPEDVVEQSRMGVKSYFDHTILSVARHQNPAHNLLELLQQWMKMGAYWNDDKPVWSGTATELLCEMRACAPITDLCDEWKVATVAKRLTDLAKTGVSGVNHVEGSDRGFEIQRTHK